MFVLFKSQTEPLMLLWSLCNCGKICWDRSDMYATTSLISILHSMRKVVLEREPNCPTATLKKDQLQLVQ